MNFLSQKRNKHAEEHEGTCSIYGDTVKDTSTVNEDIDYVNVTYAQNDRTKKTFTP